MDNTASGVTLVATGSLIAGAASSASTAPRAVWQASVGLSPGDMPIQTATFWAIYRVSDGEVLQAGQMPRYSVDTYPVAALPAGAAILPISRKADVASGEWMVSDGSGGLMIQSGSAFSLTVSKSTIKANGVDESRITGLPNPSRVAVEHSDPTVPDVGMTLVTDGTAIVTAAKEGKVSVTIVSPGKVVWRSVIDAV